MFLTDWIQRRKHAKGFGIHSPFAYDFVTNVVHEKYGYNAFSDIEKIFSNHGIQATNTKLHHLSYRLINYFKPQKVLEIETGNGANTLYLSSVSKSTTCYCFDSDSNNTSSADGLRTHLGENVEFIDEIDVTQLYDGIFVYPNTSLINFENLMSMSSDSTFWVISGIKSGNGRRFWKNAVKDKRTRMTFDMKDIGIVILKQSYNKQHYLI